MDTRRLGRTVRGGLAGAAAFLAVAVCQPAALADVPAVSDFGQDLAQPAAASDAGAEALRRALFVTWHANGRADVEVRWIRDDAIAGFAGPHPAWRRNEGLCWWFRVPVYERSLMAVPDARDKVLL
jgi:hypothetical protein